MSFHRIFNRLPSLAASALSLRRPAILVTAFILTISCALAQTTWTGTTSTNWFTIGNWSAGIPTSTVDAVIPAGTPFSPAIGAGGAICRVLTLNAGATLTLNAALDLAGGGVLNGTFAGTGPVRFVGNGNVSGSATLPPVVVNATSNVTFATMTVAGTLTLLGGNVAPNFGQTLTVNGNATFSGGSVFNSGGGAKIDVNGNIVWNGGLTTGPCDLSCSGSWTSDASFSPTNQATVTFDGAALQSVAATFLPSVTVPAGSNISISTATNFRGTLTVAGQMTTTATLDVDVDVSIPTGGSIAFGTTSLTVGRSYFSTGSFTFGPTSTVTFDTTQGGQIAATSAFPNVVVAKPSVFANLMLDGTVNGTFTLTAGNVAPSFSKTWHVIGNATFSGGTVFTGGGSALMDVDGNCLWNGATASGPANFECGGNWTADAGFDPSNGSAVTMNGAGTRSLSGPKFDSLVLGGALVNFTIATDIRSNFSVNVGATAGFGALTHKVGGAISILGGLNSTGTIILDDGSSASISSTPPLPNLSVQKSSAFANVVLQSVTIQGSLTVTGGNLTCPFGQTSVVNGSATFSGGSIFDSGGGCLLDVNGNFSWSGAASTGPCNINCSGNWTSDAGFNPANGAVVTFDGVAPQTMSAINMPSVVVAAGSSVQSGMPTNIKQSLTVNGTFTATANHDVDFDVTIAMGGTATFGSTNLTVGRSFTAIGSYAFAPTSVVTFDSGASGFVTVATPLPNVVVQKSTVFSNISGDGVVNGTFTLLSGNFGVVFGKTWRVVGNAQFTGGTVVNFGGTSVLDLDGNATWNGAVASGPCTISCAGNWTADANFDPVNGSFVTFDGAASRNVSGPRFDHVVLAGATAVFTVATDIDGSLTVNPGATAALGAFTHKIGGSLLVQGMLTSTGQLTFDESGGASIQSVVSLPNVRIEKTSAFANLSFVGVTIQGSMTLVSGNIAPAFNTILSVNGNSTFSGGTVFNSGGTSAIDLNGNATWNGTVASGPCTITCSGNWTADAGYDPNNGAFVTFDKPSGTQTISGALFDNLVVAGQNVVFAQALNIDGGFSVNAGAGANLGAFSHRIGGAVLCLGTLASTGTLILDEPTSATVTSSAVLPNVRIEKTSTFANVSFGTLTIGGNLELVSGNSAPSFSQTLTVAGNATFSGGTLFNNGGTSVLDINGNAVWSGSQATAPCNITCAGNWTADAAFNPTNDSIVTLDGAVPTTIASTAPGGAVRFDGLVVAFSFRRPIANLVLNSDTIAIDPGGILATGAFRLTFPAIAFSVAGILAAEAGGTLALRAGTSVTISANGLLAVVGTASTPATVGGEAGGGYALTVNGTIAANNYIFRQMGPAGIVIAQSATIAPLPFDLRGGLFDQPSFAAGSVLLNIQRAAPVDLRYVNFSNSNGSPNAKNVRTLAGAAVTFTNWGGAFAGPTFEDDPSNLITWAPPQSTQLSTFTLIGAAAKVFVDFTTATEVDVVSFQIERANAIGGPYATIATLPATGAGSAYGFTDTAVAINQTYFYRLTETLNSGATQTVTTGQATPFDPTTVNLLDVGPGGFATVQDAINAATHANTIIRVAPGTYPAFTIGAANPSQVRIVGSAPGQVFVSTTTGRVTIENRVFGDSVVLTDLTIGSATSPNGGVLVQNCDGTVCLDTCVVLASATKIGVEVVDSTATAIQDCAMTGSPALRVRQNSIAQATGGTSGAISVQTGSALETCALSPTSASADGTSTLLQLPGVRPTLLAPRFATVGRPLTIQLAAVPQTPWVLGISILVQWVDVNNPVVQLSSLIDPAFGAILLDSGFTNVAGLDARSYLLPGVQPLLGATLAFEMLAFDASFGAYRLSNAAIVTAVP